VTLPAPVERALDVLPRFYRKIPRPVALAGIATLGLLGFAFVILLGYYGQIVTAKMSGRRYSIPTRIYSDVWLVRPGDKVGLDDVRRHLDRLGYIETKGEASAGTFAVLRDGGRLVVGAKDRDTAYGHFPGMRTTIEFSGRQVFGVKRTDDGGSLPYAVFEPEVVGTVFDQQMEDRIPITLDRVPKVVLDAILTTEDRDFFSHGGISFKRTLGAALKDLRHRGAVQGGSTLTQQLVKNMFLSPTRTFKRKAIEAFMAVILEAKYPKNEILEAYLNEIYLGQRGSVSVTGVEQASRFYFGKSVSQLELPEAALLAGLISSPGRYSPFRSPERAKERRTVVLRGMLEQKKITKEEYEKAVDAPLTRVTKPAQGIVAPHFMDFVLSQLKETPESVKQDGLSIYTTLDPEMQAAAQTAVERGLEDLEKRFKRLRTREGTPPLQAALIALDPATGAVRALVGGRDYQVSQFNRVVQAQRQPGSLFKPFVYLAALSRRDVVPAVTPATVLSDTPIDVTWGKGQEEAWSPKNYDCEYRGNVTVRQALEQSLNVPTVRVALVGWETGHTLLSDIVTLAKKCGISSKMEPYPSLALGSFEVTPMEIASSYCAFANGGFRMKANALLGVVGPNGRRLESKDEALERVADPDALAVLDSMLQGVVDRGTGGSARRLGAQGVFAGKTGTTNDGRDAWFIGFSPRLLVAVWVGFDDNRGLNLSGSHAAVPIYAEFARRVPAHYFEAVFPTTPNVVRVAIDPKTGFLVTPSCPDTVNELFIAGTEPVERCPVHEEVPPPGVPSLFE
jgi:penicillin-binding protein 1B